MTISRPSYCTRETVAGALDIKESARLGGQLDRALESAADSIEGQLHRNFYPELDTRHFGWPNGQYARPWRLWLDANELISVTALVAGGVTVPATDYFLEPNTGPPYTRVEIDLDSASAFGAAGTHQRAIAITGLFGFRDDEEAAGQLAEALDATETQVDISSSNVGTGNLIRVDTERMLVTGRRMLDTGQDLAADLAAQNADVTVAVADGSSFNPDDVILIGGERMLVADVAGNTLVVKRAWDGSVLAAHTTGASVFAPRTLVVTRGVLGTAAATHSTAAAVAVHRPPALIRDLAVAESLNQLFQETSGYARRGGVVDNTRNAISVSNIRSSKDELGVSLDALRAKAYTRFGRKARIRAV